MTMIEKYKVRLTQLDSGMKELYEGEADLIRKIISNAE